MYCACSFILPGHPANNGYVEALNAIPTATHGEERRRLGRATLAYNAKTKDRLGAAPEAIWRARRPLTSRWAYMAARDAIRKIDGTGGALGAEEELNKYIQRAADWERGGGLR